MSHYLAIVIIEDENMPRKQVADLMAPFDEKDEQAYSEHRTFWDWYRIGGRWDGVLLTDRETWEKDACSICGGDRDAAIHEQIERNMVRLADLPEDFHAYRIVFPDGRTISQRHADNCDQCRHHLGGNASYWEWKALGHPWDIPDELWLPTMRQALIGYHNCWAVAVDYHV